MASERGKYVIVMEGLDTEHEYVKDYDDQGIAEAQVIERNARAKALGISAVYKIKVTA